ncbi:serine/threonine protein kinase, partial [Sphaerisporangium sp. NPDC049002]
MPAFRPLGPTDPTKIASYRVTGRIGEGGQGVVYAAESGSGERVAVKLLHRRAGSSDHPPQFAFVQGALPGRARPAPRPVR